MTLIGIAGATELGKWRITDRDGQYQFRVGPGSFHLMLPNQKEDATQKFAITDEFELVLDGHSQRKERAALSGTIRSADGQPIASGIVYGESVGAQGHNGFRAQIGQDGQFLTDRWSDRMLLYAIDCLNNRAGYVVISEDTSETQITLAPAAIVTGVIRDTDQKPAFGVPVQLDVRSGDPIDNVTFPLTETTDEDGKFKFAGILPSMSCSLRAYFSDYRIDGPTFDVKGQRTIVLDDTGAIVDESGNSPSGD